MGKADRYQKLYPVTWDQLHRDAKALAWRLLEQGPYKGIIGVARGGLVPAAIVARELNIRMVDTLCICTYQGREQTGGEEVLKAIDGDGDGAAFVEWAEKFPEDMPYDYLEITITADGDGARRIVAHSFGSRSRQLLCVWANDSKSRLGKCQL